MAHSRDSGFLGWFVPRALTGDLDALQRTRMFLMSHLFGSPLGYVVMAGVYLADPSPDWAFWTIVALISAFFAFPFALKLTGWLVPLSLLSVAHLSVLVLFAAYHYGGVSSPLLPWVVAVPLNALFYMGDRPRIRLAVLAMLGLMLLAFYLAWRFGGPFPERVPLANLVGAGVVSLFCAAGFVSMMSLYYAAIVTRQQQALEREMAVRRDTETRLRASEAEYRLMADHASDLIIRTSLPDGRRTYVSPAVRPMLGYEPAELLGHRHGDIAHPDDLPILTAAGQELAAGEGPVTLTTRARRKDGAYVWLESTVRLLGTADEAISVSRDVTARRAMDDVLRQAKARAEQASHAKSQFLANMSHELRTPLNAILGFSQIIHAELLGPIGNRKYLEYSRDIETSGQHLLGLINDMLDLAKLEAGQLRLRESAFDLRAMVASAANMLEDRMRRAGVSFRVDVAPTAAEIRGDEARLRQVLLNILSNAVKFTEPGGRIALGAEVDGDDVVLIVSDTGIGIAADDLDQVMQPFGQVESTLARNREGTGLGLPLAAHIVEAHGGSLALQSELGIGTTVTIRLPGRRAPAAVPRVA